jgi:hypothetical protein
MSKTHMFTNVINAAAILAVLFAGFAYAAPAGAQKSDLPVIGNGDLTSAGSPSKGMVPAGYLAAVDGDRFASQVSIYSGGSSNSWGYFPAVEGDRFEAGISIDPAGLSAATCYSDIFHAASDCDRLASQVVTVSAGPTTLDCFTTAYHAASDCDRLSSDLNALAASAPAR